MIEALKSDEIVRKVGGRFKLAVLMQKRMVDVAFGAPLLVDARGRTMMESVVQEIIEEKISLDTSGGLVEEQPHEAAAPRVSRSEDADDE
jgi:DNA-directed RNA polymerase subunit omega